MAVTACTLNGQNLKIVRTDVDSSRSDFVTAKYLFGIDIIGDSIFKCSAVSFSLKWTNASYIKYSGWRPGNFGDSTATYVSTETNSSQGVIYCGITAAEPYKSEGYDNPYFIHFDFAVLSSAVNNQNTVFSFITLRANVNTDSGRVDIELEAEPVTYNIHSFIKVWPGDTDDNSTVNNDDVLPIDLYFDFGSEVKKSRTFKRENSSAIWKAQKVLAWDEYDATFADCDGNGVVNEADVLVLGVNAGKKRTSFSVKPKAFAQGEKTWYDNSQLDNNMLIPVYYSLTDDVGGISGIINFESYGDDVQIEGIEKNEAFSGDEYIFLGKLKSAGKQAHFALATVNGTTLPEKKDILCYLRAAKTVNKEGLPPAYLSNVNVIDSWGYIIPYAPTTGVSEQSSPELKLSASGGYLEVTGIGLTDESCSYAVYDLLGRQVISGSSEIAPGGSVYIGLDRLPAGAYTLVIGGKGSNRSCPFVYNAGY